MTAGARQATCVAIEGRAVLIEGPPGIGKSSLALALIDRGAILVGDDSVWLVREGERIMARPHRNTRGLLEVRNLGLLPFACADAAPVSLLLRLTPDAPRYLENAETADILGVSIPAIRLDPAAQPIAVKGELALGRFGLPACQ